MAIPASTAPVRNQGDDQKVNHQDAARVRSGRTYGIHLQSNQIGDKRLQQDIRGYSDAEDKSCEAKIAERLPDWRDVVAIHLAILLPRHLVAG
jgi:hypothetical protein